MEHRPGQFVEGRVGGGGGDEEGVGGVEGCVCVGGGGWRTGKKFGGRLASKVSQFVRLVSDSFFVHSLQWYCAPVSTESC